MNRYLRGLLLIGVLLSFGLSLNSLNSLNTLSAQSDTPAGDPAYLLDLLRYVPASSAVMESYITYGDYRAAEASRKGAGSYESFEAFMADETDASALWVNSVPMGGYENFLRYFRMSGGEMPDIVGFDFFDIDRSLQFGQPPALGIILQGDFDVDAIDAAHTAREYTREDRDSGAVLWCGSVGCDGGFTTNLQKRNPANIFGGDLGREFPVALAPDDGVIFSSGDLDTIETIEAAFSGERRSLADDALFTTAVQSLEGYGALRAALLVPPLLLNGSPIIGLLGERATAENVEALVVQIKETYGDLPRYDLAFFADLATEDEQIAVIGLVYNSAENAETAAEVITQRLEAVESLNSRRSWQEMITERGTAIPEPAYFTSESGEQTVLLLPFRYAPPAEEKLDGVFWQQSGMVYSLFFQGFVARDLTWLAYDLGLPE